MTSPAVPIVFGGLICWSIYRRVRRNIGRQRLHPGRSIRSIVILLLVSAWIVSQSFQSMNLLAGLGGGLLLGAALGFVGLRLTKFDTTVEGHFYRPNTHIGVAISLLFAGRIIYRLWSSTGISPATQNYLQLFQSPLTLFIFGLTVGYYLVYLAGLFKHSRDKNISSRNSEPGNSNPDSSRDRS